MRKLVTIGLVCVSGMLLIGCGQQSPRDVARSFTENMAKGNVQEAKKYASEQTGQILDMVASFGAMEINPDFRFIFEDQTIDGNRAVVRFREARESDIESINLIRIDGKWKVHEEKDANW